LTGYLQVGIRCSTRRQRVSKKVRGEKEMTAIFVTGGKQYKVSEGDVLFVEKLAVEAEETVVFDEVLAVVGDEVQIGKPVVEGAKVTAKVLKNGKSKKVIVYKMHPKKGYRRKQGHRQPYTKIQIESISL